MSRIITNGTSAYTYGAVRPVLWRCADGTPLYLDPGVRPRLLRLYGPPNPNTWRILDRSDANGPWLLVRDPNYAGYSPIHVMGPDALSDALRILWRRSVA